MNGLNTQESCTISVSTSATNGIIDTYYLIKNGDLRGFEPDEIDTIALVARYHRRATPKRDHEDYARSPRKSCWTIRTLAAILRLAESLDRSHSQSLSSVELHDRDDDVLLQVRTRGDAELELWAAARHSAPFERLIGKPLRVEISGTTYVEQPHKLARIPGETAGRRRNRRIRQKHAASAREARSRSAGCGHFLQNGTAPIWLKPSPSAARRKWRSPR